jgi:thioredoxin 1
MAVDVKEISGADLDRLIKDHKVLAVFFSTTCGPCKMLRFVLKDIAKDVDDVEIVEIDFDQNKETVEQYEVQGYPTILLFQDGGEKTRLKGLQQKPVLMKMLQG